MKGSRQAPDFGQDRVECLFGSLRECRSGVAIGTAQIASRQANKNAREPRKGAFPLQTQVNFVDDQVIGHWNQLMPSRPEFHELTPGEISWNSFPRPLSFAAWKFTTIRLS